MYFSLKKPSFLSYDFNCSNKACICNEVEDLILFLILYFLLNAILLFRIKLISSKSESLKEIDLFFFLTLVFFLLAIKLE